ncbi:MAG: NADH:flavin oxidoreductase [Thermomicrobiales bacterium]
MTDLFTPLPLLRGPALKNRLMLAPLTNQQSNPDRTANDFDIDWVRRCAEGGYALTMTCAATVQATGQAFPGQLGIDNDAQLPGLRRMADTIRAAGSLSAVQLQHGGHKARRDLGGVPAPASDDPVRGVSAIPIARIEAIREDFIRAALRVERAGFDGVEVHGAFGYLLSEFLSPTLNRRTDGYGGTIQNRSRLLFEVIEGIRRACNPHFQIGLRLSVERYGLRLHELRDVAAEAMRRQQIDYFDLALWDAWHQAPAGMFAGQTLLSIFADLPRHGVAFGVAGKIMTGPQAIELLERGCDYVLIGRAAILHADFPHRIRQDFQYVSPALPVSETLLAQNGLSPAFINYMRTSWDGFVQERIAPLA